MTIGWAPDEVNVTPGHQRVMSRENPGSFHLQSAWLSRAHDAELPLWLRVAALAFGCHQGNGHANFGPGYLAGVLGKPGPVVSRAIAKAKQKGWIDEASRARCLVVPPDKVVLGIGHKHTQCAVHDGKLSRWQKQALSAKQ